MMMHRIALGLLMAALAGSAAWAVSWTSYHNERFGTTADRPADWTEGTPPDNGDGLAFTSGDGKGKLTISGIMSVGTLQEDTSSRLQPQDGETITYKATGKNVVVVSGTKGDTIFYRRSLSSCKGRVWNMISLEYPTADKAQYDEIVAHVAGSLRAGSGAQTNDCS